MLLDPLGAHLKLRNKVETHYLSGCEYAAHGSASDARVLRVLASELDGKFVASYDNLAARAARVTEAAAIVSFSL